MNSCVVYILTVIFTSGLILRSANSNVCTPESCSPSTIDLTTVRDAVITANSTCGVNKTEDFCIKQNCDHKCDNTDPSNYHGANLTIDSVNDDTFWKSENLKENVVLELDLGHPYFFVEITVTFAFSYPAAMYFSKSDDHGASWRTLVYFSSDCGKYFNMTAAEDNDRDGFIVQCFRLDSANTELKVCIDIVFYLLFCTNPQLPTFLLFIFHTFVFISFSHAKTCCAVLFRKSCFSLYNC